MWRKIVCGLMALCAVSALKAQEDEGMEAVLKFFGAVNPEDVDPYEVEMISEYLDSPLKINVASVPSLISSGLMSSYQAASVADYRSRHGDILSLTELAAVDGFSPQVAERVAPFISLYSPRLPGQRNSHERRMKNDFTLRANVTSGSYAFKYKGETGCLSMGLSASGSASASFRAPDTFSGHVTYTGIRFPVKVTAGDFNARFGQGLAFWNGMSMGGLSSTASFFRNPSGITGSSSFTGAYALTGIAAEASLRKVTVSVMTAFPGLKHMSDGFHDQTLLPAFNMTFHGKSCRMGLTHYAEFSGVLSDYSVRIPDMKTSADASVCLGGTDIFGEIAFDWVNRSAAVVAGTGFPAGESMRMAVLLRGYPADFASGRSAAPRAGTRCSNECGLAVSGEYAAGKYMKLRGKEGFGSSERRHKGLFTADLSYYPVSKDGASTSMQVRALCGWEILVSDCFGLKLRLSERCRTWGVPFRTDFRTDVRWWSSDFSVAARFNVLHCVSTGILAYVEGNYSGRSLSVHLRHGGFRIDHWDDRIYVYERDAPGNFNVPAFYGRGLWASLAASWRFAAWGRLHVRGSLTAYPFMAEKKSGKAELKFQCTFSF